MHIVLIDKIANSAIYLFALFFNQSANQTANQTVNHSFTQSNYLFALFFLSTMRIFLPLLRDGGRREKTEEKRLLVLLCLIGRTTQMSGRLTPKCPGNQKSHLHIVVTFELCHILVGYGFGILNSS